MLAVFRKIKQWYYAGIPVMNGMSKQDTGFILFYIKSIFSLRKLHSQKKKSCTFEYHNGKMLEYIDSFSNIYRD